MCYILQSASFIDDSDVTHTLERAIACSCGLKEGRKERWDKNAPRPLGFILPGFVCVVLTT